MTLEQFFERLEAEAPQRGWYFVGDGMVRSGDNCLCPIEVADTMKPYTGGPPPGDLMPWRRRLLVCCGLASQEERGT